MTDYTDLIAKLEAAPEGSRELDALIWAEVDNRDVRWEGNRALAKSRQAPYDECLLGTIDPGEHGRWFDCDSYGHNPPIPRYTTSLDAALPWENIVMVLSIDNPPKDWTAWHQKELGENLVSSGPAKTEAIARRLAALKARAAVESDT